ncbi:pentapeptide repeat-containing protein [Streptomyces sp. Pv4-95]|uniref:pentapeptide repeat-containing protein n=1 Tax=Streptomyces sp. Pv4-95 TaxID=3049543 RepID=UPI0038927291
MRSKTKRILVYVTLALVIFGYALLLWRGPWILDGEHLREKGLQPADGVVITGVRTMLVALGAGIVAALGLLYTHRSHEHAEKLYEHSQEQFMHLREKDREQAELTREGQVTDRYIEAVKLLASPQSTERIGGIYSLERIMRDSEKDHATIVKILAAYVRQHAPAKKGSKPADPRRNPDHDVQAALSVLVERPERPERFSIDLRHTDLHGADLRRLNLPRGLLTGTDLGRANLTQVNLKKAHLERAIFDGAYAHLADLSMTVLRWASFRGADLTGSNLRGAYAEGVDMHNADVRMSELIDTNLTGADLSDAKFSGSEMDGAILSKANLRGSRLAEVEDITAEQVRKGEINHATSLPEEVAADQRIREHLSNLDD